MAAARLALPAAGRGRPPRRPGRARRPAPQLPAPRARPRASVVAGRAGRGEYQPRQSSSTSSSSGGRAKQRVGTRAQLQRRAATRAHGRPRPAAPHLRIVIEEPQLAQKRRGLGARRHGVGRRARASSRCCSARPHRPGRGPAAAPRGQPPLRSAAPTTTFPTYGKARAGRRPGDAGRPRLFWSPLRRVNGALVGPKRKPGGRCSCSQCKMAARSKRARQGEAQRPKDCHSFAFEARPPRPQCHSV